MTKRNKKAKYNISRLLIQWGILGLLIYMVIRLWFDISYAPDFEAYCPFGGMQAYTNLWVNNTLACSMTSIQIVMGLVLAVCVVLFSKLFCGYICPIGTLTEWLAKIGKKLNILMTISGLSDRILRILKYALLFITFYFTITTGELFCKEYDPFYALFSGFGEGVHILYALIAIGITLIGSIIIRQFWCKYLCPLAALSNIFSYVWWLVLILGIFVGIRIVWVELSWVVPLAVICTGAYFLEAIRLSSRVVPLLRITRDDEICPHCKLCDKACPQAILISNGDEVIRHIDCNLCGNCLTVCPHEGALNINKRNIKWIPAVLTILLVGVGIYLGTIIEIPTMDERWGDESALQNAAVYEREGLKNIKCFGSSKGFVASMKKIDGVLGAATYVSKHKIKVLYDPSQITEKEIIEHIFIAKRRILHTGELAPNTQLSIFKIGLNNYFDTWDIYFLDELLKQQSGIGGYSTTYGEPVEVTIYCGPGMTSEGLKSLLEVRELTIGTSSEATKEYLQFTVENIEKSNESSTFLDVRRRFFNPFSMEFFVRSDTSLTSCYEIDMPQAADPELYDQLTFFASHLSSEYDIYSFSTAFTDRPIARINFVKGKLDAAQIYSIVKVDSLFVMFEDGETENLVNPFIFDVPGILLDSITMKP